MLGKFLGRDRKPAAPKNQIEVVCPVCGAAQYEPRLVVTTFCRKCGEHLRIAKKQVIASSHVNPVPSAVFPAMADTAQASTKEAPKPSDFRERQIETPAVEDSPSPSPAPEPSASEPAPELPFGLGHMMGLTEDEPEAKSLSFLASELQRKPVLPEAANSAALPQGPTSAGTLQKMKEQGYYRQQYFKDVECFECHHKFKVGRSAKSTNCPTCGALICLEDFEINLPSTSAIRTRGDVLIRKHGNVNTSEIKCRDLKVYGAVSANIECSGDLILRCTGTIIGEIHCRRFVVEKGSDVRFVNAIYAEEVEIQARIFGNIQSSGQLLITASGWIHGDVTARSVSIEPGGQLDGAMNILRATPAKPLPPVGGPKDAPPFEPQLPLTPVD